MDARTDARTDEETGAVDMRKRDRSKRLSARPGMASLRKLLLRQARKVQWGQWWRYPWVWGVLVAVLFAICLHLAPDLTSEVVSHVHEEQRRMGRLGAQLSAGAGAFAPEKANGGLFGNKRLETECREVLEDTFGVGFPTVRPDFLKRPTTKRNLELDCYNADLRLALEYQGPQHRVYLPMYHKTPADFEAQQERDAWKVRRCREQGVDLIVVEDTVPRAQIPTYIRTQLKLMGRV